MTLKPQPRTMRRAASDAGLGLVLFAVIAFGILGASGFSSTSASPANAAELARVAAFTGPLAMSPAVESVAARPAILLSDRTSLSDSRSAPVLLLGVVFAVLFSFNLAFFRHLRRVYAAPPRRGRRE